MLLALSAQAQSVLNIIDNNSNVLTKQFFNTDASISFWGQPTSTEENGDLYVTLDQLSKNTASLKLHINDADMFDMYGFYVSKQDKDAPSVADSPMYSSVISDGSNLSNDGTFFTVGSNLDEIKLFSESVSTYYVTPFCQSNGEIITGTRKSISLKSNMFTEEDAMDLMIVDVYSPYEQLTKNVEYKTKTHVSSTAFNGTATDEYDYVLYTREKNISNQSICFDLPGPLLKDNKYKLDVTLSPNISDDDYLPNRIRLSYGNLTNATESLENHTYLQNGTSRYFDVNVDTVKTVSVEFTPTTDYFLPAIQIETAATVKQLQNEEFSRNICLVDVRIEKVNDSKESDSMIDLTNPCIENDYDNKKYTDNTIVNVVTGGAIDSGEQEKFESYVAFEPINRNENISVAYELPISLKEGKTYSLNVTMAPNKNTKLKLPTRFEMNYGQKGSPHRTKILYSEEEDIFIHDAEIFETYNTTLSPSDDMNTPIVQLSSNVTSDNENLYSRTLCIAEISITEEGSGVVTTIKFDDSKPATEAKTPIGYYNINGMRLSQMQKGINIIKKADGSTIKIIK